MKLNSQRKNIWLLWKSPGCFKRQSYHEWAPLDYFAPGSIKEMDLLTH